MSRAWSGILGIVAAAVVSLLIARIHALPVKHPAGPVTIGVLNNAAVADPAFAGFRAAMAELGYEDGPVASYRYSGATGSIDKLPAEAAALVARKVDMVLTLSTPATIAAKKATEGKGIPVIFAPASDPVGAGIVSSLAAPGGTITGVTFGRQETARLRWLKRLVPGLKRVLFPHNPTDRSPLAALAALRPAAAKLGIELVLAEVRTPDDLDALARRLPADIEAVFIPADALVATHMERLLPACLARKLAVTVPHSDIARTGVLFSYGFSLYDLGRQAAAMADQVITGTPPGVLPVETAEFFLSVNLRTARAIGLDLSDSVLRQARVVVREGQP